MRRLEAGHPSAHHRSFHLEEGDIIRCTEIAATAIIDRDTDLYVMTKEDLVWPAGMEHGRNSRVFGDRVRRFRMCDTGETVLHITDITNHDINGTPWCCRHMGVR